MTIFTEGKLKECFPNKKKWVELNEKNRIFTEDVPNVRLCVTLVGISGMQISVSLGLCLRTIVI